jgi:hypothetical protein
MDEIDNLIQSLRERVKASKSLTYAQVDAIFEIHAAAITKLPKKLNEEAIVPRIKRGCKRGQKGGQPAPPPSTRKEA